MDMCILLFYIFISNNWTYSFYSNLLKNKDKPQGSPPATLFRIRERWTANHKSHPAHQLSYRRIQFENMNSKWLWISYFFTFYPWNYVISPRFSPLNVSSKATTMCLPTQVSKNNNNTSYSLPPFGLPKDTIYWDWGLLGSHLLRSSICLLLLYLSSDIYPACKRERVQHAVARTTKLFLFFFFFKLTLRKSLTFVTKLTTAVFLCLVSGALQEIIFKYVTCPR